MIGTCSQNGSAKSIRETWACLNIEGGRERKIMRNIGRTWDSEYNSSVVIMHEDTSHVDLCW